MRKLWDMFFMVVVAGVPAALLIAATSFFKAGGIPTATTTEAVRGSLFSAVIGLAGIILAVLLAVLAVITSIDERPLIQRLKERKDQAYDRLVYAMLGPILVAILLAALSIVCIAVTPAPAGFTQDNLTIVVVSITLGLAVTTLFQSGYVALLLARMLVYRGRAPMLTAGDAPSSKAARAKPLPKPPVDEARETSTLQHA